MINPKLLYFGFQHIDTVDLFGDYYHTVKMEDTPHYKFLLGDTQPYREYIKRSLNYYNINTSVDDKVKVFINLLEDIKNNGCKNPIKVVKRFDGKFLSVGGQHRAAISLYLNREVPAKVLKLDKYITKVANVPGSEFGMRSSGTPYHSLFYNGKELIKGRRRDTLKRMLMIDKKDIENKIILDVGCNIGAATVLASQYGAAKVWGIDVDKELLTAAIRLNTLFGFSCYYKNINVGRFPLPKCDTAFVFAVDQHINDDEGLSRSLQESVSEIVYFETHKKSSMPVLIKEIFKQIDLVGKLGSRKLYRAEMK